MNSMKKWLLLALLAVASAGCSEDSSDPAPAQTPAEISLDDAKTRALAILTDGKVDSAERNAAGTAPVIEVLLTMPKGGKIEVVLVAASGALDKIESKAAPFDYEVSPKAGVLKYSEALAKALEQKKGQVEVWEYSEGENQWEFYVRDVDSRLWEVKMKATDGSITEVEEKAKPDLRWPRAPHPRPERAPRRLSAASSPSASAAQAPRASPCPAARQPQPPSSSAAAAAAGAPEPAAPPEPALPPDPALPALAPEPACPEAPDPA